MWNWLVRRINLWVILVGVLIAGGLVTLLILLIFFLPPPANLAAQPPVMITILFAPTPTPLSTQPAETLTPTSPPSIEGISIGSYVQITGTEGQGLRLRAGPGTDQPPRFLGMDSEVFRVKDGPKTANALTWWFLEAPYDPSRSGWAASNYLQAINPTPTPTP